MFARAARSNSKSAPAPEAQSKGAPAQHDASTATPQRRRAPFGIGQSRQEPARSDVVAPRRATPPGPYTVPHARARLGSVAEPPEVENSPSAAEPTTRAATETSPAFSASFEQRRSGSAVPQTLLGQMSRSFAHDFSGVRIHTGEAADQAARAFQAAAFTHGSEIYFANGRYQPQTVHGRWLIAHELAHVVQQRGASLRTTSNADTALEHQATRAAHAAITGRPALATPGSSGLTVQCETEAELRAQLATIQSEINAERVRINDVKETAPTDPTWELGESGKFERRDWNAIRAGEMKHLYDLLETRDVLQLRILYPDYEFLEQVSIRRIVTQDGQEFEVPERIADWALVKGDQVILGDKKSPGAILRGIKGGVPKNRPTTAADLHGSFSTSKGRVTSGGNPVNRTKVGDQILKERYAIARAAALGGKIVISGEGADGAQVEHQVPPSGLRLSRVNTYGQLPDKVLDEPPEQQAPVTSSPPPRTAPESEPQHQVASPPRIASEDAPPGSEPVSGAGARAGATASTSPAPEVAETATAAPSRVPKITEPGQQEAQFSNSVGPISKAEVGAAAAGVAQVFLVQILNHYLEKNYAPIRQQAVREYIRDALKAGIPDMQQSIADRRADIASAQAKGQTAKLHVLIEVGFVDNTESDPSGGAGTTVSDIPHNARLVDSQVVLEGETAKPYDTSTSLVGDFAKAALGLGMRSRYYDFDFEIGGTDFAARHQRQTVAKLEPALQKSVPFEKLIVDSRLGGQDPAELREYVDYKLQTAAPGPVPLGHRDDSAEYWRRMRALIGAPLEEVVRQAKIKTVPLEALKKRLGATSEIGKLIDAPLSDKDAVAQQEYLWTLGGTPTEIAKQRAVVESLRSRLANDKQLVTSLLTVDARSADELAGHEPPHPPWARIHQLKEEIAQLTATLREEESLLRSLDR
jgi:Domain of unknown function (DUF4157)